MEILYGHSKKLADLAEKELVETLPNGFGNAQAIGITSGNGVNDKLYAIAVYNEYQKDFGTCMISFVSFSPRWATKGTVEQVLRLPFDEWGVKKLWAVTTNENKRCQKLLKGVGFKQEAVLGHHFGSKKHAVIFRMMEDTFRSRYEK